MNFKPCARFAVGFLAVFLITGCTETRELAPPPNLMAATQPAVPAVAAVPKPSQKPDERPPVAWQTNKEALKIIEESEGLRLRAYRLAGQWLIGYGHATDEPEETVQQLTISERQAQQLLKADVNMCEDAVRRVLHVPVTQNQFSAMVAFCYNVGPATLANSSIVRHLNNGDEERAADAFLLYKSAKIDNEKRECASLIQRRIRERYLFLAS